MVGGEVVEREQLGQVVGDLRRGLGPLDPELRSERLRRGLSVHAVLGPADLCQHALRCGLG